MDIFSSSSSSGKNEKGKAKSSSSSGRNDIGTHQATKKSPSCLGKNQKGRAQDMTKKRESPPVVSTGKGLCHNLKIERPCSDLEMAAMTPKELKGKGNFCYDPKSYSQNFDDGNLDDDSENPSVWFSSRAGGQSGNTVVIAKGAFRQ
ncbi:hypothetical protein F0562_003348 [Nyssa sinensis]|uniref:Uncharacterized protein n=1 Tax=Nyssa sinensis TaxID=561372 RepID=A0A5J5BVA0_9ASTE|nr:hypothetical protein F0562_003348 [Nyssa sinensis]